LDDVSQLLLEGMHAFIPQVVSRLRRAISYLRREMEDQERNIFPAVSLRGPITTENFPNVISGMMSVNEVVMQYPDTEPCFKQLHVNQLKEGYESIDEVAWHHRLDASHCLKELRQKSA
jgi:hypothetical protein